MAAHLSTNKKVMVTMMEELKSAATQALYATQLIPGKLASALVGNAAVYH